jgi:gluconate 2-dehydrogenase alpha chain
VLPALLGNKNFDLQTLTNVVQVNLDNKGRRATGVTYVDARGRLVEQPAEIVLLTSYVFSNVRLMLLSGIGQSYDPVSAQGVVGRNYSYQHYSVVTLFFEDRLFNQFMGAGALGVAIDEYNGDNFDHGKSGFVGGGLIWATSQGVRPIAYHPVPQGTPKWGSTWKAAAARYFNRSFNIGSQGGVQSYRGNFLDLDPTYRDSYGLPLLRMTFDFHENEHKMSAYLNERAKELAAAIKPSKTNTTMLNGKYGIVRYQSTHNTGGAIMGADPATSAVNKYLQSWDVPNVFVVGASAFPQNSGYNPTGTVGALSYWVADAIKSRYVKNPGLLT